MHGQGLPMVAKGPAVREQVSGVKVTYIMLLGWIELSFSFSYFLLVFSLQLENEFYVSL
jgi:hypothetical protein